jgi:hypothetical protein
VDGADGGLNEDFDTCSHRAPFAGDSALRTIRGVL